MFVFVLVSVVLAVVVVIVVVIVVLIVAPPPKPSSYTQHTLNYGTSGDGNFNGISWVVMKW